MAAIGELHKMFNAGLHTDNLYSLARLASEHAKSSDRPLPYYVLASIFADLAECWDERAVTTEETKRVQSRVEGPIRAVLSAVDRGADDTQMFRLLSAAVREFVDAVWGGKVEGSA